MPLRLNPQVTELLTWHGHDSGGVQVPFQKKSPIGQPIETALIRKLRSLAKSIAEGTARQRWIFLVGGPGNGKSETIQDFLTTLDKDLGMQGKLCHLLGEKFKPHPVSSRKVVIESNDVSTFPGNFTSRVGKLIVIQDATATDEAMGNAAMQLAEDLLSLLSNSEIPAPVFVACANRGILTMALREAHMRWGTNNLVTELIVKLIRATSIGYDASFVKQDPLECWPLDSYPSVVCWPLDLESLLVNPGTTPSGTNRLSPVEQIFMAAIKDDAWAVCSDCSSKPLCPFWQNASWLREPPNRKNYLTILRRGELYTGQRWNFRDTFSLAAETIIGQWSDFPGKDHPCSWVHEQIEQLENISPRFQKVEPAYLLLRRLYPHALFPKVYLQLDQESSGVNWTSHSVSKAVVDKVTAGENSSLKPIREILQEDYIDLDPAIFTPLKKEDALREIEDEYSQSIELGNDSAYYRDLSLLEQRFLKILQDSEAEWEQDLMGRKSLQTLRVVHALRQLACVIVKRSIGVKKGRHAEEELLEEFEASLRNRGRLNKIKDALQGILGGDAIIFNMLESFGQPRSESGSLVTLKSNRAPIRAILAPSTTPSRPGYDLPFFEISDKYRIPITFDFYSALSLRRNDCSNGSLPASVRAAIDRVRHLYAGVSCRDKEQILDSLTTIVVNERKKIEFDEKSQPILSDL